MPELSTVTVAEEGNKRRGKMSSEEIKQCALDIGLWFKRMDKSIELTSASSGDFQRLEKATDCSLPVELEILLKEVNGGIYFMEKASMSCEMILDTYMAVESHKLWKNDLLPFCGDEGEMLIINTKTDEVMEWDADSGVGDTIANSLSEYMESYRNHLISGKFEYMDDIGVIEKMENNRSGK